MKTTERKALQAFMNKIQTIDNEINDVFEQLKALNRDHGSHNAYCSAEYNFENLMLYANKRNKEKAIQLYTRYCQLNGERELLSDYGSMLAELDFWKH